VISVVGGRESVSGSLLVGGKPEEEDVEEGAEEGSDTVEIGVGDSAVVEVELTEGEGEREAEQGAEGEGFDQSMLSSCLLRASFCFLRALISLSFRRCSFVN
jgi:hypothetical protein